MALSFPINPTPGQTYTYSGRTWVWTGSAWRVNDSGAINGIPVGNVTPASGSFTTLSANSTVNLGNVANVKIQGGSSGQVLSTDGTGNLSWSTSAGGAPGGSNTQVQFNNGGTFGGSAAFTFNTTSNTLTVTNIAGTITTNAQPNITSVGTLTGANVTGNLLVGTTRNDGYWGNELKYTQSAIEYSDTATAPNSANVGLAILNRNQTNLNYSVLVLGTRNAEETGNPMGMASVYSINRANETPADASGDLGFAVKPNETLGLVEKMRLTANGLVVTGNVTANTGIFTGNGSGISALNASNISSGTVPSARLSGSYTINISGAATTAATITSNAQPNITSVGTLTSLTVSGNTQTNRLAVGNAATSANWASVYDAVAVGNVINNFVARNDSSWAGISTNWFIGGTGAARQITGPSTLYIQTNGTHELWVAPSGSAGGSPDWITALSISNSGVITTSGNVVSGGQFTGSGAGLTSLPAANVTGNLSGVANITASGNLTFTGSAARIIGDFSNATHLNRTMFQTGVANSATVVGAIPNGTSAIAVFRAFNTADPTNSPFTEISANPGDSRLTAGVLGSGTALPLTFYTGGSERMRLDTVGNFGIGTSNPVATFQVVGTTNLGNVGNVTILGGSSGQVLTTNGSGSLTWTTPSGGGGDVISPFLLMGA